MKIGKKGWIIFTMFVGLLFFGGAQSVQAANEPYTIDQAPLTPPSFDGYSVVKVSSLSDLTGPLASTATTKVVYELQNDLTLTSQVSINGDKAINLNGHTLTATSAGSFLIANGSSTSQFKIYNGTITGGPTAANVGGYTSTSNGFLNVDYRKQAEIVVEDLTYNSSTSGGSFFIGLASNIYSLGTVNVSTFAHNIRAANMTFLGDFNGTAFGNGGQDDYGQGNGGVNLSFNGYNYSFRNSFSSFGNQTMSQTNGDRRIYVGKDSHVVLKNTSTSNLMYANNIGNFSTLTVDGSLTAEAIGTSLRTTASSANNGQSYKNQAGTYNGQSNINVNEGATFKVSSTSTTATYGTLFTYNTNVYSYKPLIFDMRYFGTGNFFFAWANTPYSNLYLYNQNIGVWAKSNKGIGNPNAIWQNVDWMKLLTFTYANGATNVSSSDSTLTASTFKINDYSRISNDVELPMIVPDDQFLDKDQATILNNGDTTFSGSTDYYLPGNIKVGKTAPNATVKFVLNGKTYTTTTDENGKWSFSNLDLSTIKGGTVGTIDLTDNDQRVATQMKVTVKDSIPPVATPKLIKVDLGDTTALQDPKAGVATYSDETTTAANMKFEFVTSAEDRINMINKLGVYNVGINVIDEAGNKTLVTAPVLVHPAGETITDGYVLGNDFNIDYNTWLNATDDQRRSFLIDEDYGSVKGFAISGNTVTDVTNDPAKMVVTMPTTTWAPNKTYAVSVKVNSYTKKVNVTLVPSAVKMTMKQVYTGTDTPIYSNLETKLPVDNTVSSEEMIGDTITTVMNNQISAGAFTLNYEGYDDVTVSDYKIYQNGVEVTPTPTAVPNEDFTIVYEYNGQLKFKDVAKKLDFGSITISEDSTKTPLSDSSDETISIINTVQNSSWKLKASMPTGINQTDGKKQAFLGSVIYKNATGTYQTIGQSATIIETQKDNSLYSQLGLKNDSTGMFLQQDAGNLKGSYTGSLVWTLEDTP